jgi:transposase-like protein
MMTLEDIRRILSQMPKIPPRIAEDDPKHPCPLCESESFISVPGAYNEDTNLYECSECSHIWRGEA